MATSKFVAFDNTHRLIPPEPHKRKSAIDLLPVSPETRRRLDELDAATDDRRQTETRGDESLGPHELLYGIPNAEVINRAFSHPGPYGGRFNTPERGAWYAGVELRTSLAEVAFHKRRFLENAGIAETLDFDYVDFLADVSGDFHHLNRAEDRKYLKPGPIPQCYWESQQFARSLLYAGSNGIVYQSVRAPNGHCIACFRPALVTRVREDKRYRLTIRAGQAKFQTEVASVVGNRRLTVK